MKSETRECRAGRWVYPSTRRHSDLLCALLALAAFAFHSLGDFNLQMPGTVWVLAAVIGAFLNTQPPRPTP